MGKKSKGKAKGRPAPAPAAPATRSSSSSAGGGKKVTHHQQLVDRQGRMPERDGKRFYALLAALAQIILPRLEAERQHAFQDNYEPIHWNPEGMAENSEENRVLMTGYILRHIQTLSDEVEAGVHDKSMRSYLGRRMTKEEKETICSWKVHVEDDFFVMNHIPNRGAVFVQVGMSDRQIKNLESKEFLPTGFQTDMHPPRCFVVRGLATPLEEMMVPTVQAFQQEHPSAFHRYPTANIGTLRAALVPYMGGLTYLGVISHPSFDRYNSPKDFDEAVDAAVTASRAALDTNNKENQSVVSIYDSLDPEEDIGLSRLASDEQNESRHRAAMCNGVHHPSLVSVPGQTGLFVDQMFWMPTRTLGDPNYFRLLNQAMGEKRPWVWAGFKSGTKHGVPCKDDDPCPFHVRYGEVTPSFGDCCKETYLRQKEKARRKGKHMQSMIVREPFGREDLESFSVGTGGTANLPAGLEKYMRVNFFDIVAVDMKLPLECVPTLKSRIDECPVFHAILPYKWIFLGAVPISHPQMGAFTFGDVTLCPDTGVFEAECLSHARLKHLIIEMKSFCCDMTILETRVVARPANKMKANMDALEANLALLQRGWEDVVTAEMVLDKQKNAGIGRHCSYCGEDDNEKLSFKCSCKSAYYCSDKCQSKHWKSHKKKCKALRSANESSK